MSEPSPLAPPAPSPSTALADQAFSRAAGAALSHGNSVRLLKDGRENYPAMLEAIRSAKHAVHFECYFICDDAAGQDFARALGERARAGVPVRLVYDWLGGHSTAGRKFWNALREQGVEVRVYNPPRFDQPFGWLSRNHRKSLVVDDRIAYVTGLCIGQAWLGEPAKDIEAWRDTGIEVRGPAVAEVAAAFADTWAAIGDPLPPAESTAPSALSDHAGESATGVAVRVVAESAGKAGMLRLDTLVAGLARRTLWLTDAYYAGTAVYVEALRAAAGDGVDVRLLVPGRGSDLSLVQAVSRAGYRSLLEGGVRVFEWNGPMIHAKTAVADAKWARIGSTNLNLASWLGNREIDLVVEDGAFACAMEAMYLEDLENSTEIVLRPGFRVRRVDGGRVRRRRGAGGSASRAAAGALRVGNVVGAAITRRVLGPAESRLMAQAGFLVLVLLPLGIWFPRLLAWPLAILCGWVGFALLLGAWKSRRGAARPLRSRSAERVVEVESKAPVP
ncbi:MAG: phospholipase D-like domain-containing protein [Acidobacteriota bacterium]